MFSLNHKTLENVKKVLREESGNKTRARNVFLTVFSQKIDLFCRFSLFFCVFLFLFYVSVWR